MALSFQCVEETARLLDIYQYLYPENYHLERSRFFMAWQSGYEYNPQYTYPEFSRKQRVNQLLVKMGRRAETLMDRSMLKALRARKKIIDAVGGSEITAVSKEYFGFPGRDLIRRAERELEVGGVENRTIGSRELKKAYDRTFDLLDMEYSCKLVSAEKVLNDSARQTIFLPKNGVYGRRQARRMLAHETSHAVRTFNGIKNGEPALTYGAYRYEITEEGLAAFNEDLFEDAGWTLPRLTSRVLAIARSDLSFYDLFRFLVKKGLDPETAFTRTYRVKRGLEDTSEPGGFIKDHIYFAGYCHLRDQPGLADRLYVGKAGLDDLEKIDVNGGISRAQHVEAVEEASTLLG